MELTHFVISSDDKKYINHKYTKQSEKQLAKFQKRLSRTKKGSNNRLKAIKRVQKIYTKIQNQRTDYIHKISN